MRAKRLFTGLRDYYRAAMHALLIYGAAGMLFCATHRLVSQNIDSVVTSASRAPNSITDEILEIEGQGGAFADIAHLAAGARGREEVLEKGDMEGGIWTAGLAQALVHDVPTCAELISRMIEEAERLVAAIGSSIY